MKSRFVKGRLEQLFQYFPVVLVTGARQVGKTTLLRDFVKPQSLVTFDPYVDVRGAKADPDFFLKTIDMPGFLDEVQYAPQVLSALKRFVDEHPQEKSLFYLSGSQNMNVLKDAAESMAGRVAVLDLFPLCYKELAENVPDGILEQWLDGAEDFSCFDCGDVPNVNRLMWRGFMPGIIDMPDEILNDYFDSYLKTYIERDVRNIAGVSDLTLFTRFVRLLSALSAQEVNSNELGRDLGVDRGTALRWERICEASYQWLKIPAFNRNPVKRISGKAKGYFIDTGFLCALQGIYSPEILASHPLYGHVFESFVVMEIVKRTSAWRVRPSFYHYRTHAGAEVDLLLEYGGKLFPVEFKLSSHPTKKDAKGFASFKETFPNENVACGLVVCNTPHPYRISESVWAVPWWEL